MLPLTRNLHISEPIIYHHEYENDFPKKNKIKNQILAQSLRVSKVALPFISLYRPLSKPLSIVLGASRVISSVAQMVDAIPSKDYRALSRTSLEVAIATTALACSILSHPMGMVVTTAHDMIENVSQLIRAVQEKDYKKAAEIGLHLSNNALYFACFFTASLELSIASIGMQVFLGLYNSCDEFKKGNYLEVCGHLAMAGIRGKQLYHQIQQLKEKHAFERKMIILKGLDAIVNNPKGWPALHYAIELNDVEKVRQILEIYPEQVHQTTPGLDLWYAYMGNNADQDREIYQGKEDGISTLELAISKGNAVIVSLLLEKNANPLVRRKEYNVNPGWVYLASKLINAPPHLSVGDTVWGKQIHFIYKIYTPLYFAIKSQNVEIVKILLDKCSQISNIFEDECGGYFYSKIFSAQDIAREVGNQQIIDLIVQKNP